jgi:hypothetical protein
LSIILLSFLNVGLALGFPPFEFLFFLFCELYCLFLEYLVNRVKEFIDVVSLSSHSYLWLSVLKTCPLVTKSAALRTVLPRRYMVALTNAPISSPHARLLYFIWSNSYACSFKYRTVRWSFEYLSFSRLSLAASTLVRPFSTLAFNCSNPSGRTARKPGS